MFSNMSWTFLEKLKMEQEWEDQVYTLSFDFDYMDKGDMTISIFLDDVHSKANYNKTYTTIQK